MAEAFGLAAGVLQVAGFGAEVGGALFKCAKKLHNASKEIEAVAGQVEITALSLRRVDELLKDPCTKALHTPKLYDDTNTVSDGCHEVFRELHKSVQTFEAKSNGGKIKLLSRTRWLFDSGRLMELGRVLRHYNDVLHLMVSVMTIVEGRRAATKDELQALEADLQLLAISNKDLSHSNKTLTETLAAMARAPSSPPAVKARDLTPQLPPPPSKAAAIIDAQEALPRMTLAVESHINMPKVARSSSAARDPMTDHLQRCMDSVQELAKTISSAIDAWHGKINDSSDVHGCFSKLATQVMELPKQLRCVHCARVVTWTDFKPPRVEPDKAGICVCMTNSTRTVWVPCDRMSSIAPLECLDPAMEDMGLDLDLGATEDVSLSSTEPGSLLEITGAQCPNDPIIQSAEYVGHSSTASPTPSPPPAQSPHSSSGVCITQEKSYADAGLRRGRAMRDPGLYQIADQWPIQQPSREPTRAYSVIRPPTKQPHGHPALRDAPSGLWSSLRQSKREQASKVRKLHAHQTNGDSDNAESALNPTEDYEHGATGAVSPPMTPQAFVEHVDREDDDPWINERPATSRTLLSTHTPPPALFAEPLSSDLTAEYGSPQSLMAEVHGQDHEWTSNRIQQWLTAHNFSTEWQAAVRHLHLHGERFLDLGRTGGNRDVGMPQKLVSQVIRECEHAGMSPNLAGERVEVRRLRKLLRAVVRSDAAPAQFSAESANVAGSGSLDRVSSTKPSSCNPWERTAGSSAFLCPHPAVPLSADGKAGPGSASDDGLLAVPLNDAPAKRRAKNLTTPQSHVLSCDLNYSSEPTAIRDFAVERQVSSGSRLQSFALPPPPPSHAGVQRSEMILPPPPPPPPSAMQTAEPSNSILRPPPHSSQPGFSAGGQPRAYNPASYSEYMSLAPLSGVKPLTSATYVPDGEFFGPGVGIPPLGSTGGSEPCESDHKSDPEHTGYTSSVHEPEQKKPKGNMKKMTLDDFLADQTLGSWADEMENYSPTALPGSLEASSPAPTLRPGSIGTYRRLAEGNRPRLQLSIPLSETASQTKRKLTSQRSADGQENGETGVGYMSHAVQRSTASSYSSLSFTKMLRSPNGSTPTSCGDDLPDWRKTSHEKARHSSFEDPTDARCEHAREHGRVVEMRSLGDRAIHTRKRRKVIGLGDESDNHRSYSESSVGEPTLACKEMFGVHALLERWVNSSATALVLEAGERSG